ncbi:MAG: FAD:protein FMN transferase [Acidovorax sp.]
MTWQRRAQPWLGTLVEVGVPEGACADAAFDALRRVQACMSRFDPRSDVGRFAALPVGASLHVEEDTAQVLHAARQLQQASGGLFDITQGRAPEGWRCEGRRLTRLHAAAAFDLGGIAKGYAVDCAVRALQAEGCAAGWVNAGGDLRAFGAAQLPILLRDEAAGALRPFAQLEEGAFATSQWRTAYASVAAPLCLWADALTKVVAASGTCHPLLAAYDAQAWLH